MSLLRNDTRMESEHSNIVLIVMWVPKGLGPSLVMVKY